jgi:hypothetical protein
MRVGGHRHASAALRPWKPDIRIIQEADIRIIQDTGGPQWRSRRVRNIFPAPEFDRRTVQFVASRYTDWTISAHSIYL